MITDTTTTVNGTTYGVHIFGTDSVKVTLDGKVIGGAVFTLAKNRRNGRYFRRTLWDANGTYWSSTGWAAPQDAAATIIAKTA